MNSKAVRDILELNNNFYQSVFEEFSRSRQAPWEGWDRAVEKAFKVIGKDIDEIKVLDLGCGNGRFYDFLSKKRKNIEYIGIDINNDLMKEGIKKFKNATFIQGDIFQELDKIKGKYNIVSAFGVTHHIPDYSFRNTWFSKLPNLLDKNGVLILTFWNFNNTPGDYFLGWKERKDIKRYCHQYSNEEINEVTKMYKGKNLKLLDKFTSDKENLYLLFGNI
ncbi:MAG: methyltransferase domain-containing protein [Patescibacteria group bacterium]